MPELRKAAPLNRHPAVTHGYDVLTPADPELGPQLIGHVEQSPCGLWTTYIPDVTQAGRWRLLLDGRGWMGLYPTRAAAVEHLFWWENRRRTDPDSILWRLSDTVYPLTDC